VFLANHYIAGIDFENNTLHFMYPYNLVPRLASSFDYVEIWEPDEKLRICYVLEVQFYVRKDSVVISSTTKA
jgi:hypothetical protein